MMRGEGHRRVRIEWGGSIDAFCVRGGCVVVVKGGKGGEGCCRFVIVVVVVEPHFIKLRGRRRGGERGWGDRDDDCGRGGRVVLVVEGGDAGGTT
jgi:hypothetical protein